MNVIVGVIVDSTPAATESVNTDREHQAMVDKLEELDSVYTFVLEMEARSNNQQDGRIGIEELTEMWDATELVLIWGLMHPPAGASQNAALAALAASAAKAA